MLQHDIQLNCNNKTIKQGKLINYSCDDYIVTLVLKNAKDQLKSYDLYYPYHVSMQDHNTLFDYRVSSFVAERGDLAQIINDYCKDIKTHKLFDQLVELVVVHDQQ